ncbi:hypothetical protein QYM36_016618 [Artemia franciscana]|uniref:Uncharacterized protein n=1 Tax=Artemia franciscana TaxID=6661 RepID=A0AA88KV05_ARTSF|nr:hypothetical protein QYM36_016618 [Artemia franciscana]
MFFFKVIYAAVLFVPLCATFWWAKQKYQTRKRDRIANIYKTEENDDRHKKRVADQEKKIHRPAKMILEQAGQLATQGENVSSRKDELKERVTEQGKKIRILEKMVLEQAEHLATQGENMGSGKDELKKRVAEQEKKLYRLEKMVLEQEEQLAKLRENMSSRIDVHKERVAEQDKKNHGLEKKVTRQAKKQKQEEQQERIFRLIQEVANQDFDENFLNLGLLGDSLKNPQDSDSDESFIPKIIYKTEENDDRVNKRAADQEKKIHRPEEVVLEQAEKLATQGKSTSSRIDELKERVGEQEKQNLLTRKMVLEQAEQVETQRGNISSRINVLKERVAEQEKKYVDKPKILTKGL